MEYEILHRPSYALLNLQLSAGEDVSAEAGAMVSMSSGIEIETSMRGGLFGGLKRKRRVVLHQYVQRPAGRRGELCAQPARRHLCGRTQ